MTSLRNPVIESVEAHIDGEDRERTVKRYCSRALLSIVVLLTVGGIARADGRGGGSGGWAHKMSGPGPFFTLTGKLGARLTEPGQSPWLPRWLDLSVTYFFGESDFEGTNVHGVTLAPSFEWSFMRDDEEHGLRRVFFGVGYAMTNFRGAEFQDFWRGAVAGRVGYSLTRGLRAGAGVSYFPTAFDHSEFAADPTANDHWVPFAFLEYVVEFGR